MCFASQPASRLLWAKHVSNPAYKYLIPILFVTGRQMDAAIAQMEAMMNGNGGTGTSLPVLASRAWRMRTRVGAGNEGGVRVKSISAGESVTKDSHLWVVRSCQQVPLLCSRDPTACSCRVESYSPQCGLCVPFSKAFSRRHPFPRTQVRAIR